MSQNPLETKERILFFIKTNGPSLPVYVAKYIKSDILFASAFLSELLSEKAIRISNLKVGNSPLYYLPGQEHGLEKFSQHLKSKEKDAFLLLKEKEFLDDSKQSPAIRVALRAIKDFAVPFKKQGTEEIFWRYFTVPESEFTMPKIEAKEREEQKEEKLQEPEAGELKIRQLIEIKPEIEVKEEIKEISKEEKPKIHVKRKEIPKKIKKPRKPRKKDENFFNVIKSWASANSMEILNIEGFSKNELQLKVKNDTGEHLLVAYNKKRITDSDLVKANKRAKELGLRYMVLSLGEPMKKMNEFIDAAKNLSDVRKIG